MQNVLLSSGLQVCLKAKPTTFPSLPTLTTALVNWSQVRYRKAVYFRKYHQPNFRQKLLLSVCEPVFPRDFQPQVETCYNLNPPPPRPDHPYDVLLAKDMAQEMQDNSLVCFFHQNQMSTNEKRVLKNKCEHAGMFLRYYNRDIARICWTTNLPQYKSLLHFAVGYNFTVLFAPDTTKIDKLFKILKDHSEIILLCALVDKRRLVTVKQLKTLGQLGDLDHQRASLLHTLNISQQGLMSALNYHTSQLSQMLKTHSGGSSSGEDDQQQQQQTSSTTESDDKKPPPETQQQAKEPEQQQP